MSNADGWFQLTMGLLLCLLATACIALGSNFQRYGLVVVEPKGERCGCISRGYAVWAGGWGIYLLGNLFYTYAVTLAPATLCSALMGTIVVWNGIIARVLLGEKLAVCDYHGGFLILVGIALAQTWGPSRSDDHDAIQLIALFHEPMGILYLLCTTVMLIALVSLLIWHERLVHSVRSVERDELGRRVTRSPLPSPTQVNRKRASQEVEMVDPGSIAVTGERLAIDVACGPLTTHDIELFHATRTRRTTLASLDRVLPQKGCGSFRMKFIPFAYPMVVGVIESLMTVCLVAVSRLFYRTLGGDSQLSLPVFWIMSVALFALMIGQVWWLRKALLNLPVSRVLPIEYGVVSALTMLGGIFFFQEISYVPAGGGWAIAAGITFMLFGCIFVGLRWTPLPSLTSVCCCCTRTTGGGTTPANPGGSNRQ